MSSELFGERDCSAEEPPTFRSPMLAGENCAPSSPSVATPMRTSAGHPACAVKVNITLSAPATPLFVVVRTTTSVPPFTSSTVA